MKLVKYSQDLFLIASPLVGCFLLNLSPTLAATFSFSETSAFTKKFSNIPQDIITDVDVSTITIAINSSVSAEAIASAVFYVDPVSSQNYSLSETSGVGDNYFGLSQSYSKIAGLNFLIKSQETFSFDFGAFLNLQTVVDNNQTEEAIASGNISFFLFDSTNQDNWSILDYWQVSGNLSSSENVNSIAFNKSSDAFSYSVLPTIFGEANKSVSAQVGGTYSRLFGTPINLSLIEFKNTQAIVVTPVPVPSDLLGVTSVGLFFVYKVAKRKRLLSL